MLAVRFLISSASWVADCANILASAINADHCYKLYSSSAFYVIDSLACSATLRRRGRNKALVGAITITLSFKDHSFSSALVPFCKEVILCASKYFQD